MQKSTIAAIEFSLQWQSLYATHRDRRFVDQVHFWRDTFPGKLHSHLERLQPGERYIEHFDHGVLVAPFDRKWIRTIHRKKIQDNSQEKILFEIGKFYPQGLAWRALNCFPQTTSPFRVVESHQELIVADTNHPLSRYPLTVEAQVIDTWQPSKERGGSCNDIASVVTEGGPGMQLRYQWAPKSSYPPYPYKRTDEKDDSLFYKTPRMVQHLDDTAIDQVKSLYSSLLSPGTRVLDLMSSWTSHLPDSHDSCQVTGLGLNHEELKANRLLDKTLVHDLNRDPVLPFENNSFDAVICTASIEYLTRPLDVLSEIARVTSPGGVFITTFSDRWFPGKEIEPWADLHPFERLGMILDYYLRVKKFEDMHTESILGLPRPLNDKHIVQTRTSDPVYAVWGTVKW